MVFIALELHLLDQLVKDKAEVDPLTKSLTAYLTKLTRLGSYLDRACDPPATWSCGEACPV